MDENLITMIIIIKNFHVHKNQAQNNKRHQVAYGGLPWKCEETLPPCRGRADAGAGAPEDAFVLGVGLQGQDKNRKK